MRFLGSYFRNAEPMHIVVTFASLVLSIYLSVIAASYFISESERIEIEHVVAGTILESVDAGPLKYSRLHAQKIANDEIRDLISSVNRDKHILAGIEISSGVEGGELVSFAKSDNTTVQQSCLSRHSRAKTFPDAFFPFLVTITLDKCTLSSNPRQRFFFLFISGIVMVTVTILFSLLAIQPVKKSFDLVIEMLNNKTLSSRLMEDEIPFTPFRRLASVIKEEQKLRVDAAIARTTQMLAHDVRKPFALFRMTLDRVKSAGSSEQVQQALQEALPEVERSLANVNGLISDVLNVGGEFNLVLKPVRLAPVVEDVVEELRKLHPARTLSVQVSVPSDLWVEADDTRLPRVFLNILSNAIEAVETKEVQLWVLASATEQSSNLKGRQIEIRVGNTGSYIAPEARSKLFDLFYTSGKKGGTGLGLAIVRKIIEAHGSSVVCSSERSESAPQGKVEFTWNLAAAVGPHNSSESTHPESSDSAIKSPTTPAPAALPTVAFLDDSPLARWVWESKLKTKVKVISFASPGDFWTAVENNALELGSLHTIITDHYFAPEEKITGVEFAAHVRQRGFTGRILLASNGEFDSEKLSGIVDKIVDKQPAEWEVLKS